MPEKLHPNDRVLDLRAVARSAAVFAGLVAGPLGAAATGADLGDYWAVASGTAGAVAGLLVGAIAGRVAFPAPRGDTVVARRGPHSLAVSLKASLAGGLPIALGVASAAMLVGSLPTALATLGAGIVSAAVVGSAAALL